MTLGFLLSLVAGTVFLAALHGPASAIIGGVDSSPGEFTSIVQIQKKTITGWKHVGAGVLLAPTKVLTAASLMRGEPFTAYRVVAGQYTQPNTSWSQPVGIKKVVKHKDFNKPGFGTKGNDLAMLTLKEPVTLNAFVQLATLPADNDTTYTGTTVQLVGWGVTSASSIFPSTLQKANTVVLGTNEANSHFAGIPSTWTPSNVSLTDRHLACMESAQNIGTGQGDGGGPVFAPDFLGGSILIGINSFWITTDLGTAVQSYPSVATRVSSYLPWIAANL